LYPEFARRAAQDSRRFASFKRNPVYRRILEHVTEGQGAQYLAEIGKKWPELIDRMPEFKANDDIGRPIRCNYPGVGEVSPTTLRYLKVCCDLRELFGSLEGFHVAEIGCGYGGQFFLADLIWPLGSWTLFDLDPVLQLTSRYLECQLINSAYRPMTLNRFDNQAPGFDMAISNYAFSEMPRALQLKYVAKVLSKAKRGYMTMNSGKVVRDNERLNIDELRQHLPGLQILDETPLTAPDNYIAIWGCGASA
jgi:hypothetical protein